MAPIFPSIGVTPQIIDDERLRALKTGLESIIFNASSYAHLTSEPINVPLDIERLAELLEPCQSWVFEEQVSVL